MQSDNYKYSILIKKILEIFNETFDGEIALIKKQVATNHMGFFKIKFMYLPLDYEMVFESDRDVFDIVIYDKEKAWSTLDKKYDNETNIDNIRKAISVLKHKLKNNDFCFYITRDDKLYRKENEQYIRIKNFSTFREG